MNENERPNETEHQDTERQLNNRAQQPRYDDSEDVHRPGEDPDIPTDVAESPGNTSVSQERADEVADEWGDEWGDESFPASDPPAHH